MWIVRARRVVVVACLATACGGRATPTQPGPAAFNLESGSYNFSLSMCAGSGCGPMSLCVGGPIALSNTTLSTTVSLERSGDAVTIRAQGLSETFRMDLRLADTTVGGTAQGWFGQGTRQMSVGSGGGIAFDSGTPTVTGSLMSTSASGRIDGFVWIDGYGCSNNGHTWVLTGK